MLIYRQPSEADSCSRRAEARVGLCTAVVNLGVGGADRRLAGDGVAGTHKALQSLLQSVLLLHFEDVGLLNLVVTDPGVKRRKGAENKM
jgi:hypothetical protein